MGRKYTEEEISMILDTYMYLGYQEASKEPVELKEVIGKLRCPGIRNGRYVPE